MSSLEASTPATIADRILQGEDDALGREDLIRFLGDSVDVWDLMAAADRVRRDRFGNRVHLCSIVNAKQGGCPEDCGFCSQSKHYQTHVAPDRFISERDAQAASHKALSQGASALGLVSAVRGIEDGSKAMQIAEAQVQAVRQAGHTEAHASLGLMSRDGLARLKRAGLTEYNHNLETSRRFFSKIVSTHSYDDRLATIRAAKAEGLRTCVGGIVGMGEDLEDRADLVMQLRELEVDEVPINFWVRIEGTQLAAQQATLLADAKPLAPLQMLRVIACFRLALPRPNIFIAAGRMDLGALQPMMFGAGASGMMVGDFLTTPNHSVEDDHRMLEMLGLEALHCHGPRPEMQPPATAPKASRRSLPVVSA